MCNVLGLELHEKAGDDDHRAKSATIPTCIAPSDPSCSSLDRHRLGHHRPCIIIRHRRREHQQPPSLLCPRLYASSLLVCLVEGCCRVHADLGRLAFHDASW